MRSGSGPSRRDRPLGNGGCQNGDRLIIQELSAVTWDIVVSRMGGSLCSQFCSQSWDSLLFLGPHTSPVVMLLFFFFLENPTVQFSGNYPISVQIVPGNSNTGDDFTKITGGSGVGAGRRGELASPQNSPERLEGWSFSKCSSF